MNIYDFKMKKSDGSEVSLAEYKGKVLLIVNTASFCGYTPQLKDLEQLYKTYKDEGFEILAFPANNFKAQEPDDIDTIVKRYHDEYGVTFPIFDKVSVRGGDINPLFKYLVSEKGFEISEHTPEVMKPHYADIDPNWESSPDVKWNFTKFLIDREGNVLERFEPEYKPLSFSDKIKAVL